MVKRKVAALEKIDADFASLQYKIRRDPASYKDEFLKQWEQYDSQREIFLASPTTASAESIEAFHNMIDLMAHIADCYPDVMARFPSDLEAIVSQHHTILHPELREKIVSSLLLLRRKDVIDSATVHKTLFPILVSSPSKSLRALIFSKILSDLRNSNTKAINHPLNRTIQTVLYNLVTADRASPRAIWAIKITREMWKRQLWTDAKPVDVIKEACLSDNEKVVVGAVRFFLGGDKEREELQDESSDEEVDLSKVKHQIGINKKTKKQKKSYSKAVDKIKRQERKKNAPHPLNFSALHLLHDAQGFAEQLFDKHLKNTKAKLSLDSRLLVLQLVTRLVGLHKLILVPLYSWFAKFLTPRQRDVTSFLASLAQGTHNLVPPDALEPLIQKIANEFISEASAAEVAAAGLNAVREVCARQPLAMTDTLLQDLVQYRKSKDKGVMMAAKGLLSLYREVGAELLQRRDRGKDAAMGLRSGVQKQHRFGEEAAGGIEGLDLLANWKHEQRRRRLAEKGLASDAESNAEDRQEEADDDEWEVASDDSSESGDWIDVSSESEAEREVVSSAARKERKRQKMSKPADGNDEHDRAAEENDDGDGGDQDGRDAKATPDAAAADDDDEKTATELAEKEAETARMTRLATTTVLTPADLSRLHDLRAQAALRRALGTPTSATGSRPKKTDQPDRPRQADEGLTAHDIEAPARLRRLTKDEKVALAREGKPAREEHRSTRALRREKLRAAHKSTSNRTKERGKNFLMTLGKARSKNKRSLVEVSKALRGHVQRSTRGGRRRNKS